MKNQRHKEILDIVGQQRIETQEELAEELRRRGYEVTQATVSRDIKELRLIKVPAGDGAYRYGIPEDRSAVLNADRMKRFFRDSVVYADSSENIVVVKCLPGSAQAVAALIDGAGWTEVIGTVAGDDTILAVIKPKSAVPKTLRRIEELI
ncbi:MAG: arginine repressor [Bacillota bacterium]